eukprot:3790411-Pleurochrysis_carterae.AAC.1
MPIGAERFCPASHSVRAFRQSQSSDVPRASSSPSFLSRYMRSKSRLARESAVLCILPRHTLPFSTREATRCSMAYSR